MNPGTQADLRRHLKAEYGLSVTKQAISLLVTRNDYRILKTDGGKIKISETSKILVDSGFGKRAEVFKRKKEALEPTIVKTPPTPEEHKEDLQESGPLTVDDSRERIERHKAFHQSEKERINNEEKLRKLLPVNDISEKSFNLWRQVRNELQSLKDRVAIKVRASESDHEAEQIIHDETHRILSSIVDGYKNFNDEDIKKKLAERLIK